MLIAILSPARRVVYALLSDNTARHGNHCVPVGSLFQGGGGCMSNGILENIFEYIFVF